MLTLLVRAVPLFLFLTVTLAMAPGFSCEHATVKQNHELSELVRSALGDRLVAGDIPDIGIARQPGATHVYVRADVPSLKIVLGAEALPEIPGLELRLITLSDAQQLVRRTGKRVGFVTIDKVRIGRDAAILWLGADDVAPEESGMVKLCCCEREARFVKRNSAWVFDKWGWAVCS